MKKIAFLLSFVLMIICSCTNNNNQQQFYQNPLFPKSGADPWALFYNGNYYYMHTCGNCIKLWVTPDITEVRNAPCKTIWTPTDPVNSRDLWAPEIHRINNKWYVYYAADDGNTDNHQLYVLENENENPLEGEFVMKGRISTDPDNNWAIDGSVFEHHGQLYMVWSGWQTRRVDTETQCIYIAKMSNPWTLESERILISKPELDWERNWINETGWTPTYTIYVNEGPQPLVSPNDKYVHITYSASGCWTPYYALGLLSAPSDADLLDPASWQKSPQPVFKQKPGNGVYGTGHNSFFKSPDGTEWYILYHARSTETDPEGVGDTRSPRMQQMFWDDNDFPVFGEPIATDSVLPKPSGTPVSQWHLAGNKIHTQWAEEVNPDNVLPEYPRPQLVRNDWVNLNGLWSYTIKAKDSQKPTLWTGQILVPYPIESALSGVGRTISAKQELWYSRSFNVPSAWHKKHVILNFGAVDWKAKVFVNDQLAGEHQGGYTPFSIDITPYLNKRGEQELTLCVYDPADKGFQPRGKQVTYPNGIWYTSVTGIWQTVWMEPVEENHITAVTTIPYIDSSTLECTVTLANDGDEQIQIALLDKEKEIASAITTNNTPATLTIKDAQLWTPENPYLYDMKVSVIKNGKTIDEVASYTAMRKISIAQDVNGIWRMQLNNTNYFQYGPLDQGWWPDGLYTAPTDEALCYDIEQTKSFGFNMIRKHVKVEPARWYYHCDRLGMLVWQDMPSGDMGNIWAPHTYEGGTDKDRTEESKASYYQEWKEIMDFCKPHPCVVVWVPFNEAWGQFDTEAVVDWTKAYDPSRLVNPASGGNFVKYGDILDLHNYPAPAMYLFDPDRVNVLGEYGGIGRPIERHLWWDNRNWGYVRFNTLDEVTEEYVKYAEQLQDFVAKGFSAAIYTQTTDVEGEVNGLMTYDRQVTKLDVEKVRKANLAVRDVLNKMPQYFTLTNANDMEVTFTTFGGRITNIFVPDKNGEMKDVVLGFDNINDYQTIPSDFGACIGRYANRINKGQITIDGKQYQLATNNYGHTLHGGPTGWQYQVYTPELLSNNVLKISIVSPDGDNGFPGEVLASCTYTLTDDNEIIMHYEATANATTVINMTNHTYFNLTGDGEKNILGHLLWLNAKQMTPVDNTFMTTGEIVDIPENSPFDFYSAPKPVGQDILADNEQLRNGNGYDHNWVLVPTKEKMNKAATLYCPETGIKVEVTTTEPGIQVYSGNFLDGSFAGKYGKVYTQRNAICLETQKYPDTPNKPNWPSALLKPGEKYESTTIFKFSVE